MKFPLRFWNSLNGLITSGVAVVALLGPWQLTPEQQAVIIAFGVAVITTLTTIFSEQQTTPLAAPVLPAGTAFTVQTPEGEPNEVRVA